MRTSIPFLFAIMAAATGCVGAEDVDASDEGDQVGDVAQAMYAIYDDTDAGWTYAGAWSAPTGIAGAHDETLHWSHAPGAQATFTCTAGGSGAWGVAADLIFSRAYNRGVATIWVTSAFYPGQIFDPQQFDMYGPGVVRQQRIQYSAGMPLGTGEPYQIHVMVSGMKNPASTGYLVDIDGIECILD
ncbi:MAG: hypothetical protein IT372_07800 [Polyangiaceae bacterium]|nr:hypothetical protein [Polyangiaceae bacterium]